ncbi:hypothetical protein HC031_30640 [Planosporangium thailandense]|uniref:4-hydroxybenzoate polyprenyltransferase n=1 Tax=Planosporangium thailandense TaxID=765197 RepID=A0ABX0Y6J4_9ACTN|nr:hypothetical protein [Planosporangium thailandense]NJC74039.1 hypothetical protein [Planosporangium thailandense]
MTATLPSGRRAGSLPGRLAAWTYERFPPGLVAVLLPAYLVALLYGRAVGQAGPPRPHPGDLAAFTGFWAFFLMLRVIDDHKDYARDVAAYPGRALQRGDVTLDQLKVVAALAWAVQLAVVLTADGGLGPVGLWWVLTLAWTALAAKDFFVGARIGDRPVLQPLLHLPVSGLACLWVAQLGAGARSLPARAYAVAALGIALSASVDLVRKLLPGDGGGRAYLVALGPRRAALAGAMVVTAQTGVLAALVLLGSGRAAGALIPTLLAAGPLAALSRLAVAPAPGRARAARTALASVVPGQLAVAAAALLIGPGGR